MLYTQNLARVGRMSLFLLVGSCPLISVQAAPSFVPYSAALKSVHQVQSPGKPALDVRIHESAIYYLAADQAATLNIPLHTGLTKGQLNVNIQAQDAQVLTSNPTHWQYTLEGASAIDMPVALGPMAPGIYYLNILVQHLSESGAVSTRVLAAELRVDQPRVFKTFEKSLRLANENAVIHLPAQEKIY
jgi:hypothetical protein